MVVISNRPGWLQELLTELIIFNVSSILFKLFPKQLLHPRYFVKFFDPLGLLIFLGDARPHDGRQGDLL